eukprot:6183537-Pleurochrysis_carterae.AAC.1
MSLVRSSTSCNQPANRWMHSINYELIQIFVEFAQGKKLSTSVDTYMKTQLAGFSIAEMYIKYGCDQIITRSLHGGAYDACAANKST